MFSREAFQAHGHWLRYLHFTTESSGDHKEARLLFVGCCPASGQVMRLVNPRPACCQVLRFSFALPPRDRMAELGKVMSAAMHFVDAVGTYKLKPEQRLRAEKLRKDMAAVEWRKQDDRRREEAEERRAAKKKEELVRVPISKCLPALQALVCTHLLIHLVLHQEKLKKLTPAAREKAEARRQKIDSKRQMRSRVKVM